MFRKNTLQDLVGKIGALLNSQRAEVTIEKSLTVRLIKIQDRQDITPFPKGNCLHDELQELDIEQYALLCS